MPSSRTRLGDVGDAQTGEWCGHCVLLSSLQVHRPQQGINVKGQKAEKNECRLGLPPLPWRNGIHICFKTENCRKIHSFMFHMQIRNRQKGKATVKKKRKQKLCRCHCKVCPWQIQSLQGTLRSFLIQNVLEKCIINTQSHKLAANISNLP